MHLLNNLRTLYHLDYLPKISMLSIPPHVKNVVLLIYFSLLLVYTLLEKHSRVLKGEYKSWPNVLPVIMKLMLPIAFVAHVEQS